MTDRISEKELKRGEEDTNPSVVYPSEYVIKK
jgi:hypothetical protein